MKFLRLTILMAFFGGLVLISSCKKDPDPEPSIEEKQFKLLAGTSSAPITWVVTKVTYLNTSDRTDEYDLPNMTLTITDDSNPDDDTYKYTTTNRPSGTGVKSPWNDTGTWSFFANSPESIILRHDPDGDLSMTYTVTATKLQLTFNYQGEGFRTSAVEGAWKFEFAPQP